MIRNNLAMILSQKEIKISRMALDTGLSRTTLTALSQNESKRIDNDTLNTILMYLQIKPNDFFNFVSYDCEIKIEAIDFEVDLNVDAFNSESSYYIKKGTFDLFLEIDNRISARKPVYEFEINLDEKYNRVDVQEHAIPIGPSEYEIEEVTNGLFTFNISGDDRNLEEFNKFIKNEIPFEFQIQIENNIKNTFKEILKAKFIADFNLSEPSVENVCSNYNIVTSAPLLGFLPF